MICAEETEMEERFEAFTTLISGINHSIRKLKTEIMAEFDLKSTHLYCLYHLYKANALTAKELCDMCSEDKALISRTLKSLEERGYISKGESEKRYRAPLVLTERGREVAARVCEYADAYFGIAGGELSDEERKVLYKSLRIINERLIELCDKYEDR